MHAYDDRRMGRISALSISSMTVRASPSILALSALACDCAAGLAIMVFVLVCGRSRAGRGGGESDVVDEG